MAKELLALHKDFILQNFSRLCLEDKFCCDVTVVINEERFRCHRFVLAASSDYFNSLFNSTFADSTAPDITLMSIPHPAIFRLIVEYIYTGKLEITVQNAYDVLKASDYLLINKLKNSCMEFIEHNPEVDNFLKIYDFALSPAGDKLFAQSIFMEIKRSFRSIIESEEFLDTQFNLLNKILSKMTKNVTRCPYCNNDVSCSLDVYCSICYQEIPRDSDSILKGSKFFSKLIEWVNHHLEYRLKYLPKFTQYINLNDSNNVHYLMDTVMEYSRIKTTAQVSQELKLLPVPTIHIFTATKTSTGERKIKNVYFDGISWAVYKKYPKKKFVTMKNVQVNYQWYFLTNEKIPDDGCTYSIDSQNKFFICGEEFRFSTELPLPWSNFASYYQHYSIAASTENEKTLYLLLFHSEGHMEGKIVDASLYKYDLTPKFSNDYDECWSHVTEISKVQINSCFLSVGRPKKLLMFGEADFSHSTPEKVLKFFEPSTSTLSENPLKTNFSMQGNIAACSFGTRVFISVDDEKKVRLIHSYECETNEWKVIQSKPNGNVIKKLCYYSNRLWAFPLKINHPIEIFDFETEEWTEMAGPHAANDENIMDAIII